MDLFRTGQESFWTGGVVHEISEISTKSKFWHGSQNQIVYDNDLKTDGNMAGRPKGITITQGSLEYPSWKTLDFDERLGFICQYEPQHIGCLRDDDLSGSKYLGPAAHDFEGDPCVPWVTHGDFSFTDNFCRNPDEADSPYCYLASGDISPCDIPRCSAPPIPLSFDAKGSTGKCPATAPKVSNFIQSNGNKKTDCFKEEFTCKNGKCILKDYVCDGSKDCEGGDDEEDCKAFSLMFSKESGFKLEGSDDDKESVAASVDDCAKMCLYKKPERCESFSHRPGTDNKGDRCILSTTYHNKGFDSLVEKKSWNYYKLNDSNNHFRSERDTNDGISYFEGLRLRSKKRGANGNLVQVKTSGTWGGICDHGFNINEANVVCHQLGFKLGASKVHKDGRGDSPRDRVVLDSLSCNGDEKNIEECKRSDKVTCNALQMVSVTCQNVESECKDDQFHCNSGECIDISGI